MALLQRRLHIPLSAFSVLLLALAQLSYLRFSFECCRRFHENMVTLDATGYSGR